MIYILATIIHHVFFEKKINLDIEATIYHIYIYTLHNIYYTHIYIPKIGPK